MTIALPLFQLGSLALPFLLVFLFAGNAEVEGIRIVFLLIPLWMCFWAIRYRSVSQFRRSDLCVFSLLGAASLVVFVQASYVVPTYDGNYAMWVLQALVSVPIVLVLIRQSENPEWGKSGFEPAIWTGMFAGLLLPVFLFATDNASGRAIFIFGPNILYRLILIIWIGLLFSLALYHKGKLFAVWLITLGLVVLALEKVGSRGGVLAFLAALVFSIEILRSYTDYKARTLYLGLFAASLLPAYLLFESFSTARFLTVDFDSLSVSYRLNFFMHLIANFEGYAWSAGNDYLHFNQFYYAGFPYPHNIFGELVFFYGLPGLVISMAILAYLIVFVRKELFGVRVSPLRRFIGMTFCLILVGAQFSGDLGDNYTVIAIAIAGLWARFIRTNSVTRGLSNA